MTIVSYIVDAAGGGDYTDIQSAVDAVASNGDAAGGNVIRVKNGTYASEILLPAAKDGVNGTPNYLIAYEGHAPVIDGEDTGTDGILVDDNTNWWVIGGFEIKNTTRKAVRAGTTAFSTNEGLFVIGNYHHDTGGTSTVAGWSSIYTSYHYTTIGACVMVDTGEHNIYSSADYIIVTGNHLENAARIGDRHIGDYHLFCNNSSTGHAETGLSYSSSLVNKMDYCRAEDNVIYDNDIRAINMDVSGGTYPLENYHLSGNICRQNTSANIQLRITTNATGSYDTETLELKEETNIFVGTGSKTW